MDVFLEARAISCENEKSELNLLVMSRIEGED